METKNIYLVVGKSGCGKTTLVEGLEDMGLKSIQSYTTRPRRYPNETGHIFVSQEEFDQLKDLVAYTYFNGYHYCATAEQVDSHNLYVIDNAGVEYLKFHYKGNKGVKVVYIETSWPRLLYRLVKRDGWKKAIKRIINDRRMIYKPADCYVIKNNKYMDALRDFYNYIQEEEGR